MSNKQIAQSLEISRLFGDEFTRQAKFAVNRDEPRLKPGTLARQDKGHIAKTARIAGDKWHTDVSCDEKPPLASILHLTTIPETGGDTLFSSMYAAYDALSDVMKKLLTGLTATHDGAPNYDDRARRDPGANPDRVNPVAIHPVIATHPSTGKKTIYVNSTFTVRINELSAAESKAVLEFLFAHVARPEFQCRFRWQHNSIAFWDNRAVQHYAVWDYYPAVRTGRRVTIRGDRPC